MDPKKQYQPLSEDKGLERNTSISFHKPPVEEVLKLLKTNIKTGLTSESAKTLLGVYGANELEKKEEESIWEKIKEQFQDVLVRILLLSALISFLISYFGEEAKNF
jgi:magnesium-transporting ATPase (P-type)